MVDADIGKKAIHTYYAYMRLMYPSSFKYSEAEFLAIIQKLKGGKALLEGLGMGIREAEMSDSKVTSAMKNLATKGQGKIPASYMDFFNALMNESAKISYVDAAAYVVVESTKDVIKGAQAVGDQLILTGKILNFILPAIIIFIVLFYVNKGTDGSLVKVAKAVRK